MDKKEYFKKVVSLYEAQADPQENIANTAEDLEDSEVVKDPLPGNVDEIPEENPMGDINDGNYIYNDGEQVEIVTPENQKKERLFELYRKLLNYTTLFNDSLDNIDFSLLDDELNKTFINYTKKLDEIIDKIKTYMLDTFKKESYEKSLYVYILMRTELLMVIKLLRDLLGLNHEDK